MESGYGSLSYMFINCDYRTIANTSICSTQQLESSRVIARGPAFRRLTSITTITSPPQYNRRLILQSTFAVLIFIGRFSWLQWQEPPNIRPHRPRHIHPVFAGRTAWQITPLPCIVPSLASPERMIRYRRFKWAERCFSGYDAVSVHSTTCSAPLES